ncbi:pyruvate kinase [Candidatus Atribacteria bacterium 1244-E10-H5-B2]|nr:MAG: pyruvate kinase [Candidatus Atribacteria bacterium 1244-E10-H5-B2]
MSIMIKTKIVCTIGPASSSYEKIEKLIQGGMDVARLNFSHGSHKEHHQVIENIRQASLKANESVAVLQDLGGPKIRIGKIEKEPIFLKKGSSFILTNREVPGDEQRVSVTFSSLPLKVKKGDRIFLADGTLELKVKELTPTDIICRIIRGGELTSHKGINIPNISMDIPSLTEKDYQDILFGIENKVDFIGLSFTRNAEDVLRARKFLKENGAEDISLIAKIEKKEAVNNLKEIIETSDGIMIARGDLGVEIPLENVPLVQKDIIKRCNFAGKPVITATQMLMSMVSGPQPTRAEVTDVANAILDGTDAIMLSEETAVGNYPLEAVETMNKIALRVEKAIDYEKILSERSLSVKPTNPDAISHATCQVTLDLKAKAIVTFTLSGSTARMVSRYRPPVPIIAASTQDSTVRKLALSWGVYPFKSEELENTDDMIEKSRKVALATRLVKKGDKIIITAGIPFKIPGTTNLLKVETL